MDKTQETLPGKTVETTDTDVGMTDNNPWEMEAMTWRLIGMSLSLLLLTLISSQRQFEASCRVTAIIWAVRLDRKWADNRKSLCPGSQTSAQLGSHSFRVLWEGSDVTRTHPRRQTIAHSQPITALSHLSKFQRHTPHHIHNHYHLHSSWTQRGERRVGGSRVSQQLERLRERQEDKTRGRKEKRERKTRKGQRVEDRGWKAGTTLLINHGKEVVSRQWFLKGHSTSLNSSPVHHALWTGLCVKCK